MANETINTDNHFEPFNDELLVFCIQKAGDTFREQSKLALESHEKKLQEALNSATFRVKAELRSSQP